MCYYITIAQVLRLVIKYSNVLSIIALYLVFCEEGGVERMEFLSQMEKGQGLVEYALILVFVAVIVIVILLIFGIAVGNLFSTVVDSMENLP